MSKVFQLPVGHSPAKTSSPFAAFGLSENPFPPVGLDSGVLYTDHVKSEFGRINDWITQIERATSSTERRPMPPLALFGTLGAGKTHLLCALERGLGSTEGFRTLRRGLTDEGMTRLQLADLLVRSLPDSDPADPTGTRLVYRILEAARKEKSVRDAIQELADRSPLRVPLLTILKSTDSQDATAVFSRWLRREHTTPAQRAKIGLGGTLTGEGQAIHAIADLLHLARVAGVLRCWFVLIDQLEELWNPGVITSQRRARFLTDLRTLVDHAFEGAPVAVLLAWNTTVSDMGLPNVGEKMQRDYLALWQRLREPVNLPALRRSNVWPFAVAYLDSAGVTADAKGKHAQLYKLLEEKRDRLIRGLPDLAPREVLAAWREVAESLARAESS